MILISFSHSYTSALQTIALFGLKLNRFPAMLGAVVFLAMCVRVKMTTASSYRCVSLLGLFGYCIYRAAGMVIPSRIGWIRSTLILLFFHLHLSFPFSIFQFPRVFIPMPKKSVVSPRIVIGPLILIAIAAYHGQLYGCVFFFCAWAQN